MAVKPLRYSKLRRRCLLKLLPFRDTSKLEEPQGGFGQGRALDALQVGTGIRHSGYNLFVLGPPGVGRHRLSMRYVGAVARQRPVPDEWCYVHNFDEPRTPRALRLPAGTAKAFMGEMTELITELRGAIMAALESEEYRGRREAIEQEYKERQEGGVERVQEEARGRDIALIQTPSGVGFAPTKDGEVMSPEEYGKLSAVKKKEIEDKVETLQTQLQEVMRQVPRWVRESHKRLKELNEEVIAYAIEEPIEELARRYEGLPRVQTYLEAMKKDVVEHAAAFLPPSEEGGEGQGEERVETPGFERYQVNPMTDLSELEGAPVVYEDHPTYQNLVGQVEHRTKDSTLSTDFSLIKPGALHRANGGYLILDARRLLMQPSSYEALKQALHGRQIRIQSLGQQLSLISTVTLEPEPIPLDVKIVLIGERMLYYRICQLDPEFRNLFKIAADFEETVDWTDEAVPRYAQLIGGLVRKNELRPLDRRAVGRVIEHSARLAGDSHKLSIHIESLADLLREADYWAGVAQKKKIGADEIDKAVEAQIHRSSRVRELMQEQVIRETFLIETAGERVGQINGLAVLQLGNYAFGRPSRITCSVRLGKGELIDIEREVQLGGPLHTKGVMILNGFLGERFGQRRPLSLSARLVFEQSYGGVDGDSASSTELYALLSSLAEAPIKQGFAVTGSVNQRGEVQAIGGVNEKIEGFFDLCAERGFNGEQGVLIPASNVEHLMLRQDVVDAVREGLFSVYSISTIDEGIEVLTGMPAGRRDKKGQYPADSINGRVEEKLRVYAARARAAARPPKAAGKKSHQGAPKK